MGNPIGNMVIKVDLDGSGFNKGVTGLNRQMRMVSRELSANLSQFSRYDRSLEKSKIRVDGLTKRQKVQSQITKELKANYDKLSRETGENSAKTQAAAAKYNEAYAKLNQYDRELKEATQELRTMQKEQRALNSTMGKVGSNFNTFGPKLKEIGSGMKNVGRSMNMYVTAPVVAGFGAAVKASIDYESAFAGVRKTVNASEKDYKKLSDGIINMSKKLPVAATDIAEVGEMAGQLGIKKNNILGFTKTIIDLGESTNLTREQAATEFARFANIVDMSQESFSRLGSSIVALGNNMATTESEIMNMSMRIAAQGKLVGMTESDITGLAATMSSLGIEAEAGGTAMTMVLKKIDKAVGAGGKELAAFAQASGMSAQDFKAQWEQEPIQALNSFIGGLSNSKKEGKNLSEILADLGIKGIRESDTVLRMANNHKLLGEAVKISGKGWKENKALSEEANQRYKTMSSQLKVLKNNFVAFGISLGDAIAPYVIKISKMLTGVLKNMTNMSDGMKITITIVGTLVAALGPLIFILGAFISVVGSAMSVLVPLLISISKAGGVFGFLSGKVGTLIRLFPFLGTAITTLTGPVGWIIGALGAIGIGFYTAYKKSETFRNIVNKAVSGIVNVFKAAKLALQGFFDLFKGNNNGVEKLKNIFPPDIVEKIRTAVGHIRKLFSDVIGAIVEFAKDIGNQVSEFWQKNGTEIKQAIQNIANFFKTIFTFIYNLVKGILTGLSNVIGPTFNFIYNSIIKPIMLSVWNLMKFVWQAIKFLIISIWENIKGVIQGALNIILGIIKVFSSLFTGNWRGVWQGIVLILKGAVQLLWNLIQLWFVGKILGVVRYFGKFLASLIRNIWQGIRGIFQRFLSGIRDRTRNIFEKLYSNTRSIFSRLKNWLSEVWQVIKDNTIGKARSLFDGVRNRFNNLYNKSKQIFTNLKNWLSNIWRSIRDNVVDIAGKLWSKVRNIFEKMRDGLHSIIGKIKSHIGGMVQSIRKGINKLIDGLNWVGGKLGMSKLPKLHTGTVHTNTTKNLVKNGKIARDTFATVGDRGRGNGPGGFRHEMIEYPNGKRIITPNRDTTAYLPKGSKVYNGAQTYNALNGNLPRFSIGTMWKNIKSGASNAFNWSKNQIAKGAKWLRNKVGDVLDFVDNPGKLLNHILKAFGVDFNSLTKGMGIVGDITRSAWSKIKVSATNWLKDNLEAMSGGDLIGGILDPDLINYRYGRTAAYTAATGRPFHEGVDFPFVYKEVKTPMGGKLTRMPFMAGGYGNYVKITSGVIDMLFAHLKNFSKSPASGTMVKPGDVVGLTGNTGFSTGPHLHFEMRRNGKHFNPEPYLRRAKKQGKLSVGGGRGRSGSASSWIPAIKRAARQMKTSLSQSDISNIVSLIHHESGGNDRIYQSTQLRDGNYGRNRARGLLQYVPGTFNRYKVRGHGNILNGYNQLLAFFNNRSWRSQFNPRGGWSPTGARRFATGGKVWNGLYHLGEEGFPEWIIPTDPSRADDAWKLISLAVNDLEKGTSKNKRPSNLSSPNIRTNDTNYIEMLENTLNRVVGYLSNIAETNEIIANKNYEPIIDEYSFEKFFNQYMDKRERREATRTKFRKGG